MVIPPSGEQYEIRHGDQVVVLTEVGAGLRAYAAGGRPVLEGFEAGERAAGGRGQLLMPWPNRIRGGRYRWRGEAQQLDLTEPAKSGAIHGLTRWVTWRLIERGETHARFGYVLHAGPGWPFVLGCEVDYGLGPDGLVVRTRATNLGAAPCPYGTGAHPYLHPGGAGVDDAVVTVPARTRLLVDDVSIPIGEEPVEGTSHDLRQPQPIGARRLDSTYTDLERDADGRARVSLTRPDGSAVTLWVDEAYPYLQLFTGDTLPETRRRTGLAVEPMTCPPDAFNSGAGLVVLDPGQAHEASWGIEPGPPVA